MFNLIDGMSHFSFDWQLIAFVSVTIFPLWYPNHIISVTIAAVFWAIRGAVVNLPVYTDI